jgi:hypothetical protein
MPIIPTELWDEIIDHLHDDKSTIGTCGLVCRSWISSSRFHLFSTIQLTTFDIDTIAVLCTPGSTIPPYVRALEMYEGRGRAGCKWDLPWVSNALLQLSRLSAVESLSLSRVAWDGLMPEAKKRLYILCQGLKTLELDCMAFETLGQALHFISSAPLLECLSLGTMDIQSREAPLTKFHAPPMKRVMFYFNVYTPVVLDWLCLSQPVPSVRSLSFELIDVAQIHSISAYLQQLGPFLEDLELACTDFYYNRGQIQGMQVDSIPHDEEKH